MDHETAPASRFRFVAVGALLIAALVTWVGWGLLASSAGEALADGLTRRDLPGSLELEVRPGTWNVHLEGGGRVTGVTVTDGGGREVEVDLTDREGYSRDGSRSVVVGSFDVPAGGAADYTVKVTGTGGPGGASSFTVAPDDAFDALTVPTWLAISAITLDLLVAVGIVVAPRLRRRTPQPSG